MKLKLLFISVSCFVFLSFNTLNLFAQNSSNSNNASTSFNLNFSSELGGFYFQDPTGIQIAIEGLPYEGKIDEDKYLLGFGDLITIEIQSIQKFIFKGLLVNASGSITIPSVGVINLSGKKIFEAQEIIEREFLKTFNEAVVSVFLELPRTVTVHISGSVPYPGKFIIPAQSRVDIAILQSIIKIEPPKEENEVIYFNLYTSQLLRQNSYSLRNIKIHRKDGTISKADLVKYFRTGDLSSNPMVYDGDQIEIQRISLNTPTISISGAVRYGYELEYKEGETISDIIAISEYFEENADSTRAFVFRRTSSGLEQLEIESSSWNSFNVLPGDRILIPELPYYIQPATAWVTGEVAYPGNFPIVSGETTAKELLEMAGGLSRHALVNAAYMTRSGGLENEIPNKFNANLMARTSDQYSQGIEYLKQETALSQNRVNINLDNSDELENIILFDGDQLFVPRDEQTVFIFGQVNNPGYFAFTSSKQYSVGDYITKAGGFALSADKDRIFIIKAGSSTWFKPSETIIESGDRIFVDRNPVEDLNALRSYEIQKEQLKNTRIQLVMTGLTTITSIITTLVAIDVIKR